MTDPTEATPTPTEPAIGKPPEDRLAASRALHAFCGMPPAVADSTVERLDDEAVALVVEAAKAPGRRDLLIRSILGDVADRRRKTAEAGDE